MLIGPYLSQGNQMTATWRNVVSGLRQRAEAIRRHWEQLASENRTVLAITNNLRCQTYLRVLSLEEGWRILFAESVEHGLRLQHLNQVRVLVYDRELPGAEWRYGLRRMLASDRPLFSILLTDAPGPQLRSEVVSCGGYDLARNPLEPQQFAALVNGALALGESIDALES
jgi:DNA-binding response OmpR family regulator